MKLLKSMAAGLCMIGTLAVGQMLTASAAEIYLGDVDTNNIVDVADIVKLQKHLLGTVSLQYPEMVAADLNHDNVIDIFDLALAKRAVLSGEWVLYEFEEELQPPPMPPQPTDPTEEQPTEPDTTEPTEPQPTEPTPTEPTTEPTQPDIEDVLTLTEGMTVPANLAAGTPVIVRGVVNSSVSEITSVSAGVYNSNGTLVTGRTVAPWTLSYDLHDIDRDIEFNKLAEGTYYYKVTASNAAQQNVILANQKFTVGTATQEQPSVTDDTITLSGGTVIPASIVQGTPVIVRGTLTSKTNLTYVMVTIVNSAGRQVEGGGAENMNTNTYDLHQLDNVIGFNNLTPGEYTYRITASNTAKANQIVEEQRFTVTAN